MKIILQAQKFSSVEDYAIWRGTFDAILDVPSETLFSFSSDTARELRNLYELAYWNEKESGAYESECDFEVQAIIHTYSDATGWGKLYSDQFIGLLDFDYRDLTWDDFVDQGGHVTVRFKRPADGKIKIINIKR